MIPILLGTHEYEWAINIFSELFAKYYGDESILYFGDRQEGELPSNINFQPVPCFSEGSWPWKTTFGEGLKSICYSHFGDIILIFLPDHWLNKPVDKKVIQQLESYMKSHPNVVRANLTDDLSWHTGEVEKVETWQDLEIVEVKPWSIHAGFNGGITFCPSLWNPQLLGRTVQSHWELAVCEYMGTEVIKRDYPNIRSVGSHPAALTRTHGLFHAQPKRANIDGLSEEDKNIVLKHLPEGFLTVC